VHEREKKKKEKDGIGEESQPSAESVRSWRAAGRLDKAVKWAKNSKKRKSKKVLPTGSLSCDYAPPAHSGLVQQHYSNMRQDRWRCHHLQAALLAAGRQRRV
jgi:hypothetical protein